MSYFFDRGQLHHEPYYDTAEVCLGGHMVNYHTEQRPQHNKAFCPKCGKATISACPPYVVKTVNLTRGWAGWSARHQQ
jgi:Uncharacterized protein conserved in bacteria (DUF2321)